MSRFDICRFKQPPDDEFQCGICKNVLDDPKESPCRHVFCKVCITRALQEKSKCPICRTSCRERHLKDVLPLVQNLLNKLQMECEHTENGCEAHLTLEGFVNHIANCDFMMVSCKNEKCDQKFLRRDSEQHECLFKTFVCNQGCECDVLCNDKDTHSCLETLLKKNKEAKARIEQLEGKVKDLEAKALDSRNNGAGSSLDDADFDALGSLASLSPVMNSDLSLSGSPFSYNDLNYPLSSDSLSNLDGPTIPRSPSLSISDPDSNGRWPQPVSDSSDVDYGEDTGDEAGAHSAINDDDDGMQPFVVSGEESDHGGRRDLDLISERFSSYLANEDHHHSHSNTNNDFRNNNDNENNDNSNNNNDDLQHHSRRRRFPSSDSDFWTTSTNSDFGRVFGNGNDNDGGGADYGGGSGSRSSGEGDGEGGEGRRGGGGSSSTNRRKRGAGSSSSNNDETESGKNKNHQAAKRARLLEEAGQSQSTSTAGVESDGGGDEDGNSGNGGGGNGNSNNNHTEGGDEAGSPRRRSARLRNLPVSPSVDDNNVVDIADIDTPVPTSALLQLYSNDGHENSSSSSDDTWSPYLDLRYKL